MEKKQRQPGYYWVIGNGTTLISDLTIAEWCKGDYWILDDMRWKDSDFIQIFEERIPEPKTK